MELPAHKSLDGKRIACSLFISHDGVILNYIVNYCGNMADRKAINKYYPPDWDPSKGSVNRYKKSHPLRDRARKIDQGILVVRFEMPFNVWCLKCNNHIGMGVRYNAEKSKVGSYYTSPIHQFRMKCHLCDNYFVIQSEPSKFDYTIISGARRQISQNRDEVEDLEQFSIDSEAETKKKMTDAMFRLEKKVEDKLRSESQLPGLHELKKWRSRWEDSFSANQLVRSQFRKRRKQIEDSKKRDNKLLHKTSLNISLVEPCSSDTCKAKEIFNQIKSERLKNLESIQRKEILNSMNFIQKREEKSTPGSSTNTRSCKIKVKVEK